MDEVPLYSAGDCPICPGFGVVLFVRAQLSGRIFFLCPTCDVAWSEPPSPTRLDDIDSADRFAPDGIELPNRLEIEAAGLASVIATELVYADWAPSLDHFLST